MQIKDALGNRLPALTHRLFSAFEPDPRDILVIEDVEYRGHVVVEVLDGSLLDAFDPGAELIQFCLISAR